MPRVTCDLDPWLLMAPSRHRIGGWGYASISRMPALRLSTANLGTGMVPAIRVASVHLQG